MTRLVLLLTYEQLERRLNGLLKGVPDYLVKRVPEPAICPDLDSAKKERSNAEEAQRKADSEWESAREALDAARAVREGLNTKNQEARVQLDLLAKDLKHSHENLVKARKGVPDDALDLTLAQAISAVAKEEGHVISAEASLQAILTPIIPQISADRMNVIRVVLGVVILHKKTGAMDPVIVGAFPFPRPCPRKMNTFFPSFSSRSIRPAATSSGMRWK